MVFHIVGQLTIIAVAPTQRPDQLPDHQRKHHHRGSEHGSGCGLIQLQGGGQRTHRKNNHGKGDDEVTALLENKQIATATAQIPEGGSKAIECGGRHMGSTVQFQIHTCPYSLTLVFVTAKRSENRRGCCRYSVPV